MNRGPAAPPDLHQLAVHAMRTRGLEPEFPSAVLSEVGRLAPPSIPSGEDLRSLGWCSIDNDDSRDLDQLSTAMTLPGGSIRLLIAIADVDGLVKLGSAIDRHAALNTTSVYTAGGIFPMLPERLSTDLTSLNAHAERNALVVSLDIDPHGEVTQERIRFARVRNDAKLAYSSVGAWLDGGPAPAALAAVAGLPELLRLQAEAAQRLRHRRQESGALPLDTGEAQPVVEHGRVVDIRIMERNRAMLLIEDVMVAANGAVARFLGSKGLPSIRRVVRQPERWDRIVALAKSYHMTLPAQPDGKALEAFLIARRTAAPALFADLSLAVVKLIGKGEYVVERPGHTIGHFGLAVQDYTHSTAPNRRYPDLITHRLVKAALAGTPSPYSESELDHLAIHCTTQEDAAAKVERQIRKSAAALLLINRIGEPFDGVVTGSSDKGVWVRTQARPVVEGRLNGATGGVDVGDQLHLRLVSVNVERGFIDFERDVRR